MQTERFHFDDVEFQARAIKRTLFKGIHSGNDLTMVEAEFVLADAGEIQTFKELTKKKAIKVDDVSANRSYSASIDLKQSSYRDDSPERYYRVVIKEHDVIPEVHELDIEGHRFKVIAYIEKEMNGVPARYALLQLTAEQLSELRRLIKPGPLSVTRIGVDQAPLSLRFGGRMYWSRHDDEESGRYYKHIVRLFPSDMPMGKPLGVPDKAEHTSLIRMIVSLTLRFEALTSDLVAAGVISADRRQELLKENWKELASEERDTEVNAEVRRVPDAEKELDLG
jgi:hypothetical protein